MTDLDRRLATLGETPLAAPPTLPELRQRAGRIRRRRQGRRVAVALVAAGLLVALWDVLGGLDARRVEFPPADQGQPAPAREWPLGFVVADRPGVHVIPFDTPDQAILLEGDRFYEQVMWAYPDQRGGLVLQHEVTPPPWPPGAVLWLRAGAGRPELLVPPQAPSEPHSFPRAGVLPIGMATSAEGRSLFVYAASDPDPSDFDAHTDPTRIMAADLDDGGALRELAVLEGTIDPMFGRYHAVTGGGVVAAIDRASEDCLTVTALRVDDGAPLPVTADCLPGEPWAFRALSHDGRHLGSIFHPDGSAELSVTVIDLATGVMVRDESLDVTPGDSVTAVGLTSSPGGWLVYLQTPRDELLVDLDGAERVRVDRTALPPTEWLGTVVVYHHPFGLETGVSVGSGSAELPCEPTAGALQAQELPDAVAATRQRLYDLAAACDYEALAALARDHAALVFVSGDVLRFAEHQLESDEDLIRGWVADGRADLTGMGIRSPEPLAALAALLATTSVYIEHATDLPPSQPQREAPAWVWPAEYLQADPASRVPTMDADYRVGIAPDGTWRFLIAGDFTDA